MWTSLGVRAGDDVAGHVMWAYDDDHGTHWIGGVVVSMTGQGKGVGRTTPELPGRPCDYSATVEDSPRPKGGRGARHRPARRPVGYVSGPH